jgi:hypothetical protein
MFGIASLSKKIIAVADITSDGVDVAIVAIHEKSPATIVASSRTTLPLATRPDDVAIAAIIASLADAGQKAIVEFLKTPYQGATVSEVYAMIHAPWTRSKTVHTTSVFEKETRITPAMIEAAAQTVISKEAEPHRNTLIESSVVRVELNGYSTASPAGKSAHKLAVAVLLSDCHTAVRDGVTETLSRLFPKSTPVLRSGTRGLLTAVRSLPSLAEDYVIVDVMGDTTTIVVVRENLASDHTVILEGVQTILKRISKEGMPEETLSLVRMLDREECSDAACKEITQALAHAEIELARVYGDGLTRVATPVRLPVNLVLIADPDLAPWLEKFFARIDFSQCTFTAQPFVVHRFDPKDIAHLVTTNALVKPSNQLLIAAALVNSEK